MHTAIPVPRPATPNTSHSSTSAPLLSPDISHQTLVADILLDKALALDSLIDDEDDSEEEGNAVEDVELDDEVKGVYGKPIQIAEDGNSSIVVSDNEAQELQYRGSEPGAQVTDLSWEEGKVIISETAVTPPTRTAPLAPTLPYTTAISPSPSPAPSSTATFASDCSNSSASPAGNSARAIIMQQILVKQDELRTLLRKARIQKIDQETIAYHISAYLRHKVFNEAPSLQPITVSASPEQAPIASQPRTSLAPPIALPVSPLHLNIAPR